MVFCLLTTDLPELRFQVCTAIAICTPDKITASFNYHSVMAESSRKSTPVDDQMRQDDHMLQEGEANSQNKDTRSHDSLDAPSAISPSSVSTSSYEMEDDLEEPGSGSDAETDSDHITHKCQVCLEKYDTEDMTGYRCGCKYCVQCLNQLFRVSFTTRALYPPKCGCHEQIEASEVKDSLDEDVLELLEKVPEEWWTANPTYCGQEGCGAFIPASRFGEADNKMVQFASCVSCNTMTCSKCKQTQAAHDGLCGKCPRKTVSPELYSFVKKNKLSRCPSCKTLAELEEGCNSVRYVCMVSSPP